MVSPVLILLAGGKSARMGFPKGLLDYHGTFWILEQISSYKYVDNPKVVIGLGYDYELYFKAIPWFYKAKDDFYLYDGVEVRVVINRQPVFGAFSTLLTVLNKINKKTTALIQPVDVPLLNTKDLRSIINKINDIIIPKCKGNNGHPVKLLPQFWNTLLRVDKSSKNARLDLQIKAQNTSTITYVKVSDKAVYLNINTSKDWNNYLKNVL